MDFQLSKEHQMVRTLFQTIAQKEVKPYAQDVDEEERFPKEAYEKFCRYGFMGIPYPKEWGGQGCDTLTYAMCVEEVAKVCCASSTLLSAHTSLGTWPIYKYGTEEQKRKYMPKLTSGEYLGAFGLTEPNAGTDSSAQRTTAVLKGDHYLLNGSKIFITNAGYADLYVVFAMTERNLGNHGISAFIIEKGFPGFSVGKPEKKMGIRGSATCELFFKDCVVPKENLLGQEGKGFIIAMTTLDGGRIGIAAQALGLAEGALNETIQYVKERKQFGRALSKFQNTQFAIAEMLTKTQAAQLLLYKAAIAKDRQKSVSLEAAEAKLFCADVAMDVTTRCVQLHGGYGYMREYAVERMMRDAKITEIYEGTSEVQKMVISKYAFK
ncbi:MAG: acyl-CoA dehydrogenase [Oscillospiraceae bacterium]|jgi:butyryl-CoA dehydrogenase|nr:acyl-CoA dehydrogenase [Oscillospiraceae bacterium]